MQDLEGPHTPTKQANHVQDNDSGELEGSSDWDDETAFMSLLDLSDVQEKEDSASAVVDKLQPAFLAQDRQARQLIKDTYFHVINDIRRVHSQVDRVTSPALLAGLSIFVTSSKTFEDAILREQDLVGTTYTQKKVISVSFHPRSRPMVSQNELDDLYMQLAHKRDDSDELVKSLETNIGEHGDLCTPLSVLEPGWLISLSSSFSIAPSIQLNFRRRGTPDI
ncbi:hypothetical protein CONPUDRAFT_149792 [Coniophora puteana RWD-64-598 SS2]|uniref:Uncharacterized protein n=1 Tax=Coniophora puteana (strain RWD-64-598) TaxID=741705 RepID=A0A5M3N1M1_CONPW|nr:uncharacterized protein CONPUDRAFT_149792 [Coniophora puteana RWD-64-598 SS2]EIW84924.1 hypothetical protein CONPUDRAFT_149792 [Coniophora puteana RWD-64-598 SS2]